MIAGLIYVTTYLLAGVLLVGLGCRVGGVVFYDDTDEQLILAVMVGLWPIVIAGVLFSVMLRCLRRLIGLIAGWDKR